MRGTTAGKQAREGCGSCLGWARHGVGGNGAGSERALHTGSMAGQHVQVNMQQ